MGINYSSIKIMGILMLVVGALWLLSLPIVFPLAIGLVVLGLCLAIGTPKKTKLNEKGEDKLAELEGLYNFMKPKLLCYHANNLKFRSQIHSKI